MRLYSSESDGANKDAIVECNCAFSFWRENRSWRASVTSVVCAGVVACDSVIVDVLLGSDWVAVADVAVGPSVLGSWYGGLGGACDANGLYVWVVIGSGLVVVKGAGAVGALWYGVGMV